MIRGWHIVTRKWGLVGSTLYAIWVCCRNCFLKLTRKKYTLGILVTLDRL